MDDAVSIHRINKPLMTCTVIKGLFGSLISVSNGNTVAYIEGASRLNFVLVANTAQGFIGWPLSRHCVWCHRGRSLARSSMQRWCYPQMLGWQLTLSSLMMLSDCPVCSFRTREAEVIINSLIVSLGLVSQWDQICIFLILRDSWPGKMVFSWDSVEHVILWILFTLTKWALYSLCEAGFAPFKISLLRGH